MKKEELNIFYLLQKNAGIWMKKTFEQKTANWQTFDTKNKRVIEQYTVLKRHNGELLKAINIIIVYKLDDENYYTYIHNNNI